jgi:hypothetical protein
MPGPGPGIFVLMILDVRERSVPVVPWELAKNFFTFFVDAIFTTLLEPLFTNTCEVLDARSAESCLCRVRHAD